MKTLLLVMFAIYTVIIGSIIIGYVFHVQGLLIALITILSVVLLINIFYITIFFINKKQEKNINNLNLKKTNKVLSTLLKLSKFFPYLKSKVSLNLVYSYLITNEIEDAKQVLNKIKVKKIKDKQTLIDYFVVGVELSFFDNSFVIYEKYSNAFKTVTNANVDITLFLNNYLDLIKLNHNDKQVDKTKVYDYFLKITKDTKFDKLFLLYVKKITINEEYTLEDEQTFSTLSKGTFFENK